MDLTQMTWRLILQIYENPGSVGALSDDDTRVIELIENGLATPSGIALLEDGDDPFTEDGREVAKKLKESMDLLRKGVSMDQKKLHPDSIFDLRGEWKTGKLQKKNITVTPDAGMIFVGKFTFPREGFETRELNKVELLKLEDGFNLVTKQQKQWKPVEPYAYQLEEIGGPEIIAFGTKKKDYVVPIQSHFHDYLRNRYKAAKWFVVAGAENPPIVMKGSGRNQGIGGVIAVVLPLVSKTSKWIPPEI